MVYLESHHFMTEPIEIQCMLNKRYMHIKLQVEILSSRLQNLIHSNTSTENRSHYDYPINVQTLSIMWHFLSRLILE